MVLALGNHKFHLANLTPETIHELYWNHEQTIAEISEQFGTNRRTLNYWMKKWGIKRRTHKEAIRLAYKKHPNMQQKRVAKLIKPRPSKSELLNLYNDQKMSTRHLAFKFHVSASLVRKWLRDYGISRRPFKHRIHYATSVHNVVFPIALKALSQEGFKRLIVLGKFRETYTPDAIALEAGAIYAVEISDNSKRRYVKNKIERAKKAGFDGVVFYFYGRTRKNPIEKVIFEKR